MQKKKPNLTPDAAKILEQYRNAGKKTANPDGSPLAEGQETTTRQNTPPPSQQTRRSGTRGK